MGGLTKTTALLDLAYLWFDKLTPKYYHHFLMKGVAKILKLRIYSYYVNSNLGKVNFDLCVF